MGYHVDTFGDNVNLGSWVEDAIVNLLESGRTVECKRGRAIIYVYPVLPKSFTYRSIERGFDCKDGDRLARLTGSWMVSPIGFNGVQLPEPEIAFLVDSYQIKQDFV